MDNRITSSQNINGQIYFNLSQNRKWWDDVSKPSNMQSINNNTTYMQPSSNLHPINTHNNSTYMQPMSSNLQPILNVPTYYKEPINPMQRVSQNYLQEQRVYLQNTPNTGCGCGR